MDEGTAESRIPGILNSIPRLILWSFPVLVTVEDSLNVETGFRRRMNMSPHSVSLLASIRQK